MDKATLESLKNDAEKRCAELYNQGLQINTELERTRGDFRTIESLLANWQEKVEPEIVVNDISKAVDEADKKRLKAKIKE